MNWIPNRAYDKTVEARKREEDSLRMADGEEDKTVEKRKGKKKIHRSKVPGLAYLPALAAAIPHAIPLHPPKASDVFGCAWPEAC